ncbi:MAG: hypothetical protein A2X59_01665 [Nitrospirae bacterium GWC2_42_7]|nr:MAG: hypothetical protein A2X59_01665 [Nitrospirae bacterium GWC2_42_7]
MQTKKITSVSNPKIRQALDLREKRNKHHLEFLTEGPHLIEMAVASGCVIGDVFASSSFLVKNEGQKLLRDLSKTTEDIFEVPDHLLNKLGDTKTPQGIIAVVSYQPLSLENLPLQNKSLLVVIDGVQDPGNLGTIIRTSDASAADAVLILPGTCDTFMPKVIRSTAGSIFNIPVIHTTLDELLGWVHQKNIKLFVASVEAERSVYETDLKVPLALIFGNEAHGVSKQLRESADMFLKIPILGKAESLNVSVSAAICLYEAVRQRNLN